MIKNNIVALDDRTHMFRPDLRSPCINCDRYIDGTRTCRAFIEKIPTKIWTGKHKHTSSFKGDFGITFKELQ